MSDAKLASALATLDKQANLLRELHSYASEQAKTAAALAQAVKLAQDGMIDVSDIGDSARRLKADGSVKMSSVDALFGLTPGNLDDGPEQNPTQKLDPLTSTLRSLSSPL